MHYIRFAGTPFHSGVRLIGEIKSFRDSFDLTAVV